MPPTRTKTNNQGTSVDASKSKSKKKADNVKKTAVPANADGKWDAFDRNQLIELLERAQSNSAERDKLKLENENLRKQVASE